MDSAFPQTAFKGLFISTSSGTSGPVLGQAFLITQVLLHLSGLRYPNDIQL